MTDSDVIVYIQGLLSEEAILRRALNDMSDPERCAALRSLLPNGSNVLVMIGGIDHAAPEPNLPDGDDVAALADDADITVGSSNQAVATLVPSLCQGVTPKRNPDGMAKLRRIAKSRAPVTATA